MRAKAVVLEIDGDSAVVLKEGGEFLRVPLRGRRWHVGLEVHLDRLEGVSRRPPWRLPVAWATAAALLLIVVAGWLVTPAGASSYVTVDIDPNSVGLVTDDAGGVLDVLALNAGAGALLGDRAQLLRQPVDRVIVLLVDRAVAGGLVAPDPAAVVFIAAAPLKEGQGLPAAVEEAVDRARQQAARLLQERGVAAGAAVIAVDEPEVGPRLGRVARQRGVSVADAAIWVARQLAEAGTSGAADPAPVVNRLEQVPAKELRHAGTLALPGSRVLEALLERQWVKGLPGLPQDTARGGDGNGQAGQGGEAGDGHREGSAKQPGTVPAPGRGGEDEGRGGRAGEKGPGGGGEATREKSGEKARDKGRGGVKAGTKLPLLPPIGGTPLDPQPAGDGENDAAGGSGDDAGTGGGAGAGLDDVLDCPGGAREARGPGGSGEGPAGEDGVLSGLARSLEAVLQPALCGAG